MFPSLLPAIGMLAPKLAATVQWWVPDPSASLPGESEGAWAEPVALPQPHSISIPKASQRTITSGGETITVDLLVLCPGGIFPTDITPEQTRAPRLYYEGVRYRVLQVGNYGSLSDHAEVYVSRDLGREPT